MNFKLASLLAVVTLLAFTGPASAEIAALDVSTANTYLETNASTNMTLIGTTLFGLSGLAVSIRWIKATFFS